MPDALDDRRLYVFVFGPGYGESVAVRVPPDEWLVIDSCPIAKVAAPLHVLRRYGGRRAVLLLTHRHRDHYRGFVDLLMEGEWAQIGCNDWRVADAEPVDAGDPEEVLRGELAHVFAAIQNQWRTRPGCRLLTRRGAEGVFSRARLHILHPDEPLARSDHRAEPNHLSAAAVLVWQGMNLLFGADVENPHWVGIAGHRSELGSHAVLKVPHHGSREALHECYLRGAPGRSWLVTPYNRNRGLPRYEDDQGLAILLRHEDPVHLTGLPVRHSQQLDAPCDTTRQDLLTGRRPRPIPFYLPGGLTGVEDISELEILACYVGVSLDETGAREVFHGPGSVRVRATEPPATSTG